MDCDVVLSVCLFPYLALPKVLSPPCSLSLALVLSLLALYGSLSSPPSVVSPFQQAGSQDRKQPAFWFCSTVSSHHMADWYLCISLGDSQTFRMLFLG